VQGESRVKQLSTHCRTCGEPLREPRREYCSRECRLVIAGWHEFTTLRFILINSTLERRCRLSDVGAGDGGGG
jgi:predicted nucleic acid-binding Zn ribbon protein